MRIDPVLLQPLIALLAGILILIMPRLLNYIVAIYLILVGLAGLAPHLMRSAATIARREGGARSHAASELIF